MTKVNPKWNNEWHVIVAKFPTKCSFSKFKILKGEKCLFKPSTREVISEQSSKFKDVSLEEDWHQRFINEIRVFNDVLRSDKDWLLLFKGKIIAEGSEFDCLKEYQQREVHSFTGHAKAFGYKLITKRDYTLNKLIS